MEGVCVGQGADLITHLLVEITGNLAHDRRRALRLQGTGRAVVLAGPVVDDVTLVDVAGTGQLCVAWTDIDVALRVENEVASTESAIGTRRLVPHRNVRCDADADSSRTFREVREVPCVDVYGPARLQQLTGSGATVTTADVYP